MTNADMDKFVDAVFDRIKFARNSGQAEYARNDQNVFANFDRIARLLDKSREEVMLVYLTKHFDGIISHIRGHQSQREPVSGRFADLHTYLLLLEASLAESKKE